MKSKPIIRTALVRKWDARGLELLKDGEREQAGIYQVCAFQLSEVLDSKKAANVRVSDPASKT